MREVALFILLIVMLINIGLIGSIMNLVNNINWNQNAIKDKCGIVDHLIKIRKDHYGWDGYVIFNVQNINVTHRIISDKWEHKIVEWELQNKYPIGSNRICYYQPNNMNYITFDLQDLSGSLFFILFALIFDIYCLDIKSIFKDLYKWMLSSKLNFLSFIIGMVVFFIGFFNRDMIFLACIDALFKFLH